MTADDPASEPTTQSLPPWRRLPASAWIAAGGVLAWFGLTLARYISEAPDLDSLIDFRRSAQIWQNGIGGLVNGANGEGVHPPLFDLVSLLGFTLFGPQPGSIRLMSIPLFVIFAIAVERVLARYVADTRLRVAAAVTVTICPAVAGALFSVWREGLMSVALVVALALALEPGGPGARPLALGVVLALLPLTKEAGIVFVVPFAVDAALTGVGTRGERARRTTIVLGIPVLAMLLWWFVRTLGHAPPWETWVFSEHADDGPFVVAMRAMLGMEDGIYLRQNLANAFIVNYLWLPASLAIVTIVVVWVRGAGRPLRRPIALLVGLVAIYTWTTLTFPTFSEPRYATPVIVLTLLIVVVGLPVWARPARYGIVAALFIAFLAGTWSPTDPVSRAIWGTTSVGGEQIYDTAERQRGPDRMSINLATLSAGERVNAQLRRIYASGATLVVGDCNAMKLGEKLATIGDLPAWFDREIPGARRLRCVFPNELPVGAADGPDLIALVRTPEQDLRGEPLAITGSAVVVVH